MLSIQLVLKCTVVLCFALADAITLIPCKKGDNECVKKSAQEAWPILLSGSEELGIELGDPLKVNQVDAELADLKYSFSNSTLSGLKDCIVQNITFDLDKSNLHVDFHCRTLILVGQYEIKGKILVLPIEGKGPFKIETRGWEIYSDMEVKEVAGSDGTKHLQIKNFKLDHDITEYAHYGLENLFNGQQDLADNVLKVLNDNWRAVAQEIATPGLKGCYKRVVKIVNKFLKTVPLESLFL